MLLLPLLLLFLFLLFHINIPSLFSFSIYLQVLLCFLLLYLLILLHVTLQESRRSLTKD